MRVRKAVAYARSGKRDPAKAESDINEQIERMRAYARKYGIDIHDEITEFSNGFVNREGLADLRRLTMAKNDVEIVLVTHRSRLVPMLRYNTLADYLYDELRACGVIIQTTGRRAPN